MDARLVVEAYENMMNPLKDSEPVSSTDDIEKGIEEFEGKDREDISDEEMNEKFDYFEALYAFASDYHSGQNSPGYRILSRVGRFFKPSPLFKGYDSLTDEGKAIYDDLEAKYADKF